MSSSSLQTPQSAQALHLEAVQQVVEWIAAAPQSSPPERHDVQETLPASAATQEPADPLVQAAVRPVAVPTAPVVDESPDRSAAPSERLAPPERAVVQAPAERAAEPARAAHWPPPAEEEPSGESVSLSIGSIHVTVEAPAQPAARAPAPAPHTAAPAPAPSRLVRHYLRPD
ncbi:MAG: hypothetical protein GWN95_00215 [Gammaproteobacteria bacterium]|nr:hypothetical protein [Gammaproteobacteria bacterium]